MPAGQVSQLRGALTTILLTMQQTATAAPTPTAASFASLISALIAPAPKSAPKNDASSIDDGLADDVATLSYERAMRSHARYRASDIVNDRSLPQSAGPESMPTDEVFVAEDTQPPPVSPQGVSDSRRELESEPAGHPARQDDRKPERNRKTASITIRLSKAECAQMHQRAAEAGLTVSAYLRSCTFEAESLRAQVKEALAQLRSAASSGNLAAAPKGSQTTPPPAKRNWFEWMRTRRF